MKVLLAQLNPVIGALKENTDKIISVLVKHQSTADVFVFPELAICGYPPEDLLLHPSFAQECEEELQRILPFTKDKFVVVGLVRRNLKKTEKPLFNSAAILFDGKILGYKDKTLLPTYDIFDERRYFEEGENEQVFIYKEKKIIVFICEDIWQHSGAIEVTHYRKDPVLVAKKLKPDIAINISASPYYYKKLDIRRGVVQKAAISLSCPLIYCNQVGANDQLVFSGQSFVVNKKGEYLGLAKSFQEDKLVVDLNKPSKTFRSESPIQQLYHALILGVRDYFHKQGFKKAIIGLSGGVDSALVATIAVEALGSKNILGLSMPSRFSSIGSVEDAKLLAKNLAIHLHKVDIDHLFQKYLDSLAPFFKGSRFDTTEENLQARIRGMILMAFSNKKGYIVLSTGNKSEMAMGYSTLYGDMCGGLGVLIDVSKTLVYELCDYINAKKELIPKQILKKAPSAELRENQTDQDFLPPYEIVDAVLEDYVQEHKPPEQIAKERKIALPLVKELIFKIHQAEYKRRQSPVGIRVTKKAFNRGRNFPIVHKWHRSS